jgi:hypothetical protein
LPGNLQPRLICAALELRQRADAELRLASSNRFNLRHPGGFPCARIKS